MLSGIGDDDELKKTKKTNLGQSLICSRSAKQLYNRFIGKEDDKVFNIGIWVLIAIVFIFVLLRSVFFTAIVVDGDSMLPTLNSGDYLVGNRLTAVLGLVERGDIITVDTGERDYKYGGTKKIIKRVIGIEGDEIDIKNGKVYLNGQPLEEEYLAEGTVTKEIPGGVSFPIKVGKGEVFILGDNRSNSKDGRYEVYAHVKVSQIFAVIYDGAVENTELIKKFY